MKENIKSEIVVNNQKINVLSVDGMEYISLTDLARYDNNDDPSGLIKQWMSKKDSFDYYGLWEELNNPNFNSVNFHLIKNSEVGRNRFLMNPTKWKKLTNAIGIIPSSGKYSIGTFAHPDIAFEFASWLSPEFKLYLIKEFERLKKKESYQEKIEWNTNRILSKLNYLLQTSSVKNYLIPTLTEKQKKYVYAEEADIINVALFGMTAKEWRDNNKELAKAGNIRDYTDLLHLIILNNLETTNAELIKLGLSQEERLIRLNKSANEMMRVLEKNKLIDNLKKIEKLDE